MKKIIGFVVFILTCFTCVLNTNAVQINHSIPFNLAVIDSISPDYTNISSLNSFEFSTRFGRGTIRSTGGRHYYRYLAVQGFNTNIDHTINYFTMLNDVVEKKLLIEVHYYDPFQFTIDTKIRYMCGVKTHQNHYHGK